MTSTLIVPASIEKIMEIDVHIGMLDSVISVADCVYHESYRLGKNGKGKNLLGQRTITTTTT